jgi:hypothetical protein
LARTGKGIMKSKLLGLAAVLLGLMALSACSAPRPVIFEAEYFDGKAVGEGRTAYLLPTSVDLSATVQDFVSVFSGDPAAGEEFLLGCLDDFMSGSEDSQNLNVGGRPRYGTHLKNLASVSDVSNFGDLVNSETDKYGITKLDVIDPEGLASILESAGFDYLVLCRGLGVTRQAEAQGLYAVPSGGGSTTFVGGGDSKFATLYGQAIIWDRATKSVIWNGYISGKHSIYRNFTKNTVQGMAGAFAMDLGSVLR